MTTPSPAFKTKEIDAQFDTLINGVLRALLLHMSLFTYSNYGKVMLITRLVDKVDGESGVHTWGGGADARLDYDVGGVIHKYFTDAQADEIEEYFNSVYARKDGRATVLIHSFKDGPRHFHIQISPLMERYNP